MLLWENPVTARLSRRELQAAWQQRLKCARSLYTEKVAIRKEMLAERRGLEPDPDGRFALHLALQEGFQSQECN